MMKKLMALLLCVAMLMVGVVAQAESGYVYIKTLMKEGLSLQPDISEKLDGTNEEKLLVVLFDIQKQNVFWRATTCGVHTKERCGTWNPRTFWHCSRRSAICTAALKARWTQDIRF